MPHASCLMPHRAAHCGLDYSESSQTLSIAYAMHNLREKSVHDCLRLFHFLHFWISLDLTTPIATYLDARALQQRLRTFPQPHNGHLPTKSVRMLATAEKANTSMSKP